MVPGISHCPPARSRSSGRRLFQRFVVESFGPGNVGPSGSGPATAEAVNRNLLNYSTFLRRDLRVMSGPKVPLRIRIYLNLFGFPILPILPIPAILVHLCPPFARKK